MTLTHCKTKFGFCSPYNSLTKVQTTFSGDCGNQTEDNNLHIQY